MKKYIIISITIFFLSINTSTAKDINIKTLKNILPFHKKINWNLSKEKLSNAKCYYNEYKNNFYISPSCFVTNKLPNIWWKKAVNSALPNIKNFKNKYNTKKEKFSYSKGKPIFENDLISIKNLKKEKYYPLFLVLDNMDFLIKIPKYYFAKEKIKNMTFYVTNKNLDKRWDCSKENYLKAIDILDWKTLYPEEKFNYNTELDALNSYCKGKTSKEYKFYSWVCGATTQLFRNSLINPYIKVTKRYSHNQRYVLYYDRYLYGDDASVYEYFKQFEIKNNWNKPIYFKTVTIKWQKYLVSIYPKKSPLVSYVTRKQIDNLKSYVWTKVFNTNSLLTEYKQYWTSSYQKKNWKRN